MRTGPPIALLIACTVWVVATPQYIHAGCISKVWALLSGRDVQTSVQIDPIHHIRLRLEKAYPKWLKNHTGVPKAEQARLMQEHPNFTVLAKFGAGADGAAYLVRGLDGKEYVLKIFHETKEQESINYNISAMNHEAAFSAKVVQVMPGRRAMVLEYVKGMTVKELTETPRKYGLTSDQARLIRQQFEDFKRKNRRYYPHSTHDFNVVYEFETGRLVLIDPF